MTRQRILFTSRARQAERVRERIGERERERERERASRVINDKNGILKK